MVVALITGVTKGDPVPTGVDPAADEYHFKIPPPLRVACSETVPGPHRLPGVVEATCGFSTTSLKRGERHSAAVPFLMLIR